MGFISNTATTQAINAKTIIIPTISTGNVAQLAVDILIENLSAERIGYLEHDGLLPVVGQLKHNNGKEELVTSADVYFAKEQSLVILQQRAPVAKAYRAAYQDMLISWVEQNKFGRVVILSGMNAFERIEVQLNGSQLRCLTSSKMDSEKESLAKFGCTALEPRMQTEAVADGIFVHGGGMCRSLFNSLNAKDVDTIAVLRFCMPGDTRFEATQLATVVHFWFQSEATPRVGPNGLPSGWALPLSWEKCYGTALQPEGLF